MNFPYVFLENKREDVNRTPVEMSVHAVQSDPIPIDIKFSETSSLSYMERLLLKKHRLVGQIVGVFPIQFCSMMSALP